MKTSVRYLILCVQIRLRDDVIMLCVSFYDARARTAADAESITQSHERLLSVFVLYAKARAAERLVRPEFRKRCLVNNFPINIYKTADV